MPTVKIMAMEKQNGALQKDYQNIEDMSQATGIQFNQFSHCVSDVRITILTF